MVDQVGQEAPHLPSTRGSWRTRTGTAVSLTTPRMRSSWSGGLPSLDRRLAPGGPDFFIGGLWLLFRMTPQRPSSLHEPTNEIPSGRLVRRRQHQPSVRRVREDRRDERPAQRLHHLDHETNHETGHECGPAIAGPTDHIDRWGTCFGIVPAQVSHDFHHEPGDTCRTRFTTSADVRAEQGTCFDIVPAQRVHNFRFGGSSVSNLSVNAVPPALFGANDPAQLRLVADTSRRGRPVGGGFNPCLGRGPLRHTAWSQPERADRITSMCFQSQRNRRVPAWPSSRTRTKNGEPGGLTIQCPVARTALAHGVVEEREQDGRTGALFETALPVAPVGSGPRGPLWFAALGVMKRPEAERTAKTPASRRTARMATVTGGRHNVVKVRLSDRELGQLTERAERASVSLQRFLFEAAMSGSAAQSAQRRQAAGDAQRARIVLTGVANNVNQLAKWANANHVLPDGFNDALDEVRRATTVLTETTERLQAGFVLPR